MPDDAPQAIGVNPENELAAYLFWELDACAVPPQFMFLLRAYAVRRLSHVTGETLSGLPCRMARDLCRAYIEQAIAEFTAWTPFAFRQMV